MSEEICFSPEDQQFIDRAIDFCQQMGERAVLVLAGSRSTSFADEWSDLDLWIIGDKRHLSDKDRRIYEQKRELFVDRGDLKPTGRFMMKRISALGWERTQMNPCGLLPTRGSSTVVQVPLKN